MNHADRLPPMALEAEVVVLSALMLCMDPNCAAFVETVSIIGDRGAFYQPDHGMIYDAILACAAKGRVDGFLVQEEMEKRGTLDQIGGQDAVFKIINSAPNPMHGPHYAGIVADRSKLRQLITLATEVDAKCRQTTRDCEPANAIGEQAASRLARIVGSGAAVDSETAGDIAFRVVEEMGRSEVGSVKIGFREFDEVTGGIFYGEEVILAARPSMGKSALAKQIAWNVAKGGVPVALISQEESKAKIVRNLISLIAQVDNHRIRKPTLLTSAEWTRIYEAQAQLAQVPLHINDRARSLRDVRAAAASLVSRYGCKLLVIDYLQRINLPGGDRYEKVTEISQGVSDCIKELQVAGLVLAQISREAAKRDDKRPGMTDLRESGQIEQDADGIVFLHREDYYHLEDQSYIPDGTAELIIAKWRDGIRNKVIKLKSDLRHQGFCDGERINGSGYTDKQLAEMIP